jgi:hypothetical protein
VKTGAHRAHNSIRSSLRNSFALVSALLLLPHSPVAQQARPTESQVKAAYLYNFGKFVTWPEVRGPEAGSFEICILGKDPFGEVLDATVNGESIERKQIRVRRLATVQNAASCNILFISASEESRLSTILSVAQRLHLLTVSDIKHFAERGGVIGLVPQQERIRFEVNRSAAERCHLVLSSELLKVATRVIENSSPGN